MDEVYVQGPYIIDCEDELAVLKYIVPYNERNPGRVILSIESLVEPSYQNLASFVGQNNSELSNQSKYAVVIQEFFPNGDMNCEDYYRGGVGSFILEHVVYSTAKDYDANVVFCSTSRNEMQQFLKIKHGFKLSLLEDKRFLYQGIGLDFFKIFENDLFYDFL